MKTTKIIDPKLSINIGIRVRPITGIFDSDWDGVPNDDDCVWYDPRKQELKYTKIDEWKEKLQERKQLKKEGLGFFERRQKRIEEDIKLQSDIKKAEKRKECWIKKRTAKLSPRERRNLYYCKFCKKTFPKKLMRNYQCPYCGDDVGIVKLQSYTRDELSGRPDTERGVPYYKK